MKKKEQHSRMYVQIKKQSNRLLVIIISLLLLFFTLSILNGNYQSDSINIVNIVGRQRMLSQMIAKDATHLSTLYNDKNSAVGEVAKEQIDTEISFIKQEMFTSLDEYEMVNSQLASGYVISIGKKVKLSAQARNNIEPLLKEVGNIWGDFRNSAELIVSNESYNQASREALAYINTNNEELLKINEGLMKQMVNSLNEMYFRNRNVLIGIILFTSAIALVTVNRLYTYLYKPLDTVFMGFHQIGLMDYQTKSQPLSKSLRAITNEAELMFEGVYELIALMENINMSKSFKESLEYIYRTFSRYVPYTHVGIALFNDDGKVVTSYGVSESIHEGLAAEFIGYVVNLEDTSLGKIIESGHPRVINDYLEYFKDRKINKYSEIILKHGIRSSITIPLMSNQRNLGFIFFSSSESNIYEDKHVQFLKTVSNAIAVSMEKNVVVDDLVYSSVLALAKLAEARDEDTGNHLQRMKDTSVLLTKLMMKDSRFKNQIDTHYISEIDKFSPMHDIGKVGVPDYILLKPGKLTEEEFEIMKRHTIYGAEVLKLAEDNVAKNGRRIFGEGVAIASGHHEQWDGSGYPNGLKGEEIPLSARIVMVADVLDALMSKRPYKEAFTYEYSVELLLKGKGTHFDPNIIDIFEANLDLFRSVYENCPEDENKMVDTGA